MGTKDLKRILEIYWKLCLSLFGAERIPFLPVYPFIRGDTHFHRITWCARLSAGTSPRLLRAPLTKVGARCMVGTSTEWRKTRKARC